MGVSRTDSASLAAASWRSDSGAAVLLRTALTRLEARDREVAVKLIARGFFLDRETESLGAAEASIGRVRPGATDGLGVPKTDGRGAADQKFGATDGAGPLLGHVPRAAASFVRLRHRKVAAASWVRREIAVGGGAASPADSRLRSDMAQSGQRLGNARLPRRPWFEQARSMIGWIPLAREPAHNERRIGTQLKCTRASTELQKMDVSTTTFGESETDGHVVRKKKMGGVELA